MSREGWMDGRMDGWMDGRTDGRTDGWMDGWMDNAKSKYTAFRSQDTEFEKFGKIV